MLTRTAPRTTRARTKNVGLEMDYSCICGRRFATERGMKIYRTKMGCLNHFPTSKFRKAIGRSGQDSKIVLKIDSLLGKSTLEHKLATFGDIVYQTCLDTFGTKQHKTKCPPQRSRRQLEMDTLRKQKRKLKKQIKSESIEETNGLLVIWRQLKTRHSALSRAESARKKCSQKRKNQERFIRDPFQFARQLFQ
ncbi:reverse transcriptase [Plakobranchus ocellatus]|uniref:Reverse transcriptase n=1 Tax=Plakobranchus ocellatus TaxID=259542 RepID=A0AAV4B9K6_9GAST|nr:reverse transcriptase [Plakobranchus ocellatus]